MKIKLILSILIFFLVPPAFAQSNWVELPHSKVRSHLFENSGGTGYDLLFEFQFEKNWHTYWTNPGDSGAPPRFQFKNLADSEKRIIGPLYPAPERIVLGPITTYGFSGNLLLPFKIKGDTLPTALVVDLEFLVCDDICIPANHIFKINTQDFSKDEDLLSEAYRLIPTKPKKFQFSFDNLESNKLIIKTRNKEPFLLEDIFLDSNSRRIHSKPVILQSSANQFEVIYPKKVMKDYQGVARFKDSNGDEVAVRFKAEKDQGEIWLMIAFAFLGGLILNLMPCVLPVLSLKVLSLSKSDAKERRQSILGYSLGVFLCFEIFAIILLAFRGSGEALGWGFQLQSPWFLVFMTLLFGALSANLFGIWEFDWTSSGGTQSRFKSPFLKEIPTGFLSVLVASPCTAPFMGASLGYALTQPTVNVLTIFASLSLGLAFPFLPGLIFSNYRIPLRSGPWMQKFKVFLGFPLIATCLWLAYVYGQVTSSESAFWLLGLVILLFMGLWFLQINLQDRAKLRVLAVILLSSFLFFSESYFRNETIQRISSAETDSSLINWIDFSEEKLQTLRDEKKTIFVDFTADWCLSCKVNEQVTFETEEIQSFVAEKNIVMMKADWTKKNPEITKILKNYGRIGVPLYLLFRSGQSQVQILPEVLTPQIFKDAFQN